MLELMKELQVSAQWSNKTSFNCVYSISITAQIEILTTVVDDF